MARTITWEQHLAILADAKAAYIAFNQESDGGLSDWIPDDYFRKAYWQVEASRDDENSTNDPERAWAEALFFLRDSIKDHWRLGEAAAKVPASLEQAYWGSGGLRERFADDFEGEGDAADRQQAHGHKVVERAKREQAKPPKREARAMAVYLGDAGFFRVSNWVWSHLLPYMPARLGLVLIYCYQLAHRQTGMFSVTGQAVAKFLGSPHRETGLRHLRRLVKAGILEVEREGVGGQWDLMNRARRYRFVAPELIDKERSIKALARRRYGQPEPAEGPAELRDGDREDPDWFGDEDE